MTVVTESWLAWVRTERSREWLRRLREDAGERSLARDNWPGPLDCSVP